MEKLINRTNKLIAFFAVLLILSACSKDSNPNEPGDNDNDFLSIPSFSLSGDMKKLVYYYSMTNSSFQPYISFEDFDLGSGKIIGRTTNNNILFEGTVTNNGEVNISFATSFPKSEFHLYRFLYQTGESEFVTPTNLRTSFYFFVPLSISTFIPDDNQGNKDVLIEELPVILPGMPSVDYAVKYYLICAEESGEVFGVWENSEYDMTLKKGWNILKVTDFVEENKVKYETVENIPAEAFFHYGRISEIVPD